MLFQKVIEGLEGKINCQAPAAPLLHCLGWSDWQAQTQGISESAAAAAVQKTGLRKTCYLSCDTDLVPLFSFIWNENFYGIG